MQQFRAIKKLDQWIVKDSTNLSVIVENKFTKEKVEVPTKALARGLRRPSRTDKAELTSILDYIIISNFKGAEKLVSKPETLEKWKNYVEPPFSYSSIPRRFDVSARGTNLIAFYSAILWWAWICGTLKDCHLMRP